MVMNAHRRLYPALVFALLAFAPPAVAGVSWSNASVDDALRAGRGSGEPTLVYFTAEWCPSCQALQRELLSTTAGAAATRNLQAIKVDVDAPGGEALVEHFVVLAYPSAVLLSARGEELGRIVGFESPADWTAQLKRLRLTKAPVPKLRDALARAPDSAQATLALGRVLLERGQRSEGEALLHLVTVRWPKSDAAAESLWCLGRYYQRVRREPATSQHIWRELGERFSASIWAAGAWSWYAKAQVTLGRPLTGAEVLETVARRDLTRALPLRIYGGFIKTHAMRVRYARARDLITNALAQNKGALDAQARAALQSLLDDLR